MRRGIALVLAVFTIGLLAGCGPDKDLVSECATFQGVKDADIDFAASSTYNVEGSQYQVSVAAPWGYEDCVITQGFTTDHIEDDS